MVVVGPRPTVPAASSSAVKRGRSAPSGPGPPLARLTDGQRRRRSPSFHGPRPQRSPSSISQEQVSPPVAAPPPPTSRSPSEEPAPLAAPPSGHDHVAGHGLVEARLDTDLLGRPATSPPPSLPRPGVVAEETLSIRSVGHRFHGLGLTPLSASARHARGVAAPLRGPPRCEAGLLLAMFPRTRPGGGIGRRTSLRC